MSSRENLAYQRRKQPHTRRGEVAVVYQHSHRYAGGIFLCPAAALLSREKSRFAPEISKCPRYTIGTTGLNDLVNCSEFPDFSGQVVWEAIHPLLLLASAMQIMLDSYSRNCVIVRNRHLA